MKNNFNKLNSAFDLTSALSLCKSFGVSDSADVITNYFNMLIRNHINPDLLIRRLSIGAPIFFSDKIPSKDSELLKSLLFSSFGEHIEDTSSRFLLFLAQVSCLCFELCEYMPVIDAVDAAYSDKQDYYDSYYMDFLAFDYVAEKNFADLVQETSMNYNATAYVAGRHLFKIILPYCLGDGGSVYSHVLKIFNEIHPRLGNYIKKLSSYDRCIENFYDRFGDGSSYYYWSSSTRTVSCAIKLGTIVTGMSKSLVIYKPDKTDTDIFHKCLSECLSFVYSNPIFLIKSLSKKPFEPADEFQTEEEFYFFDKLDSLNIPECFHDVISESLYDIADITVDEPLWNLSYFLTTFLKVCWNNIGTYVIDSGEIKIDSSESKKLYDRLRSLCHSISFVLLDDVTPAVPEQGLFCVTEECIYEAGMIFLCYIKLEEKINSDNFFPSVIYYFSIFITALRDRILFYNNWYLRDFFLSEQDKMIFKKIEKRPSAADESADVDSAHDSLSELNKQIEQLNATVIKKDKAIAAQEREISSLMKKIEKLNEEISSLKKKPADNENEDENLTEVKELTLDEKVYEINRTDKKILIVGGHPASNQKIENMLDNVTFTLSDKFDDNLIWNNDFVFVNASFINHHTFYKVDTLTGKAGMKFDYLNGSNVDNIIDKIHKTICGED